MVLFKENFPYGSYFLSTNKYGLRKSYFNKTSNKKILTVGDAVKFIEGKAN